MCAYDIWSIGERVPRDANVQYMISPLCWKAIDFWRDWEESDKQRKWLPFYQLNYCLPSRELISFTHTHAHKNVRTLICDIWSPLATVYLVVT